MIRLTRNGEYILLNIELIDWVQPNGPSSIINLSRPVVFQDTSLKALYCDQSVKEVDQVLNGTHNVRVRRTGGYVLERA